MNTNTGISLALIVLVLCAVNVSCAAGPAPGGAAAQARKAPRRCLVFVGTYTRGESEGIYVLDLDMKTGELGRLSSAKTVNPSFVALHPSGRYLYAVNEVGSFEGKPGGGVSAFSIEKGTGKLTLLNQQSSRGGAPCHLVVDATGKNVLVANYSGGSVASLPIGEDGKLAPASSFIQHEGSSVDPRRQKGPHAHSIDLDASNRFAFSCDLGLDEVLVYRFNASAGKLTPNEPPSASVKPGSGPRHFALTPDGRFAYVNNEMTSTVTGFKYEATKGVLTALGTVSTLPGGFEGGNSTAEIAIHPGGRFLYCSNRGHDSIAVFAIDAESGSLTPVEHQSTRGKTPRSFAIDPTGTYILASNQGSGTIEVFRVDRATGELEPAGHSIEVPTPVCAQFLPIE